MKGKQMRRRRADSSDEEDANEGVKQKTLAELREEQKQRKAKLGIQAACTFETGDAQQQKKSTRTGDEDEDEDEAEKQRSIGEMMESSFTGMRYVKKDETSVHDRIMEQYINEKLGTKKKKEVVVEEPVPGATKLTKRDKLLAITEEIHAKALGASTRKSADDGEGAVGEGAPIAYSTGIAEVALPMEFKLQNIEATERARIQHKREQQQRANKPPQEEIIGSLTHNYHHHRREYAIEMRAREGHPPATSRREGGEGPKGKDTMTDDHVYAKFKKRKF